jgi:hypothetical protein
MDVLVLSTDDTNPRLKSLLVLVGIIGDEASDAGGFNAIFPGGLAGGGENPQPAVAQPGE